MEQKTTHSIKLYNTQGKITRDRRMIYSENRS